MLVGGAQGRNAGTARAGRIGRGRQGHSPEPAVAKGSGETGSLHQGERSRQEDVIAARRRGISLKPMKVIKEGDHRLFEMDADTSRTVTTMLERLRRDGLDAVRHYSQEFDSWNPPSFELSPAQIEEAIAQ